SVSRCPPPLVETQVRYRDHPFSGHPVLPFRTVRLVVLAFILERTKATKLHSLKALLLLVVAPEPVPGSLDSCRARPAACERIFLDATSCWPTAVRSFAPGNLRVTRLPAVELTRIPAVMGFLP